MAVPQSPHLTILTLVCLPNDFGAHIFSRESLEVVCPIPSYKKVSRYLSEYNLIEFTKKYSVVVLFFGTQIILESHLFICQAFASIR